jgi:heat shock protein HslJ
MQTLMNSKQGPTRMLPGLVLALGLASVAAISWAGNGAPSGDELAAATYHGIESAPVTLSGGHWEGEPAEAGSASVPRVDLNREFRITGDLDGNGNKETVALLHYNFGGSGVFSYLAVVGRDENGAVKNFATMLLGDRVQLRSARVNDGVLEVKTVEGGPGDGACCPGQKRQRMMALEDGKLVETSNEDHGRLGLEDLQGVVWRLVSWGTGEPAEEGIDVDIAFGDGLISGSSGCNRYQAGVESGDLAGEFSLSSPLAGTRMACEPGVDAIEARFLGALQQVKRYRFAGGRLVLDWSDAEAWGSLGFKEKAD